MRWFGVVLWLLLLVPDGASGAPIWLENGAIRGAAPMMTWKQLRDKGVEKQDRDFSCGAASLATLLRGYYGIAATEDEVLGYLQTQDGATSLFELVNAANEGWSIAAQGVALDFEGLRRLQRPTLVYLEVQGQGHFSIVRGIDADGAVWLADSSWGNRLLSRRQFSALWDTREHDRLRGRALIFGPAPEGAQISQPWFRKERLQWHIRHPGCRNCRAGLL